MTRGLRRLNFDKTRRRRQNVRLQQQPLSLPPRATTMLSRQLLRPLSGTRRLAQTHGARAFSATTKKRAEVELTIGAYLLSRSGVF